MSISTTRHAGPLDGAMQQAVDDVLRREIVARIAARDHAVWRPTADEISNRLGWLDCSHTMVDSLGEIRRVVRETRADGLRHALLLGMGGSSLAPEVFRQVLGVADGYLDLEVLDSTHPESVLAKANALDPSRTLYIPATKSGGTVETLSFLKFFYRHVANALGTAQAGRHFIAITDPGSGLADAARALNFRHTFLNDPHIGGRYSALSHFGLVPAAMLGVDLDDLLERARRASEQTQPAVELGAFMGAGAAQGRDKLTLIASPPLAPVGTWVEQLIAESTGKEGKGIVPVEGEPFLEPSAYGSDRLFVYLRCDDALDDRAGALAAAGHPLLCLELDDLNDLGAAFYQWELATAIAGHLMDIHPFDQPDVEAAKVLARDMVQAYQQRGALPSEPPIAVHGSLSAFGSEPATSPDQALRALLAQGQPNCSYIALQAYLNPTPEIGQLLAALRRTLQTSRGLATTLGYGPRFLHSTGQLHKGDAGHGLFLQLTATTTVDAPIPDAADGDASGLSFGVLIAAQAQGDASALRKAGRRVLRIDLGCDAAAGLRALTSQLN